MSDVLQLLQSTLHEEIPLTRQMGVRVAEYSGTELRVAADLAPNINIHGTAFGGSLYSICAVACWGLLHLKLQEEGVEAQIVLAQGAIRYLRPVREEIMVHCRLPDAVVYRHFIGRLREGRRAAIELEAVIDCGVKRAVLFRGHYSSTV